MPNSSLIRQENLLSKVFSRICLVCDKSAKLDKKTAPKIETEKENEYIRRNANSGG